MKTKLSACLAVSSTRLGSRSDGITEITSSFSARGILALAAQAVIDVTPGMISSGSLGIIFFEGLVKVNESAVEHGVAEQL